MTRFKLAATAFLVLCGLAFTSTKAQGQNILGTWRCVGTGMNLTVTFSPLGTVLVVNNLNGDTGIATYRYNPAAGILTTNFRGQITDQRIRWIRADQFLSQHLNNRYAGRSFIFTRP